MNENTIVAYVDSTEKISIYRAKDVIRKDGFISKQMVFEHFAERAHTYTDPKIIYAPIIENLEGLGTFVEPEP